MLMRKRKRKKRNGDGKMRTPSRISVPRSPGALTFPIGLRRNVCRLALLPLVFASAFCPTELGAKEKKISRVVTGAVLDEADNPVAGATVTMADVETGKKLTTFSKEGGIYQFSALQPTHDYELQATYKGISSEVRKASSVDSRNKIVLNLKIPFSKQ